MTSRFSEDVAESEAAEEARAFRRAVVEGLSDLEAGREFTLREVKARLGLGSVKSRIPDP